MVKHQMALHRGSRVTLTEAPYARRRTLMLYRHRYNRRLHHVFSDQKDVE